MGDEERFVVGFLDESRPKTTSNTAGVWSFEKPEKKRNTTNYQANTFGFYPLNGESVVEFKENSYVRILKHLSLAPRFSLGAKYANSYTGIVYEEFAVNKDTGRYFFGA
ncbi:hypothetical protein AKJ57_02875 [candidate division MSBL1 archaeon SCGC-AAA259A05]|uniref:Uncharacterized protein n=1 Tax=candidate division MSBL1 archaeon SCGC-AAA259A05 TaxID=1698259 RepID=A0A133UA07_9EURY|nr:hypothetical protein AKJ57_02875 [candidate division MSBL1 archaeon SCGC-AAA259A05]